jgi:hypothetical protein
VSVRRIFSAAIIAALSGIPALAQQEQPKQLPQQTAADPPGSEQQIYVPPRREQPATTQKSSNSTQPGAAPNSTGTARASGPAIGTNDRLFFVLPNYGTLEAAGQAQPLAAKQKFDIQLRNCFDPVEFPYVGLLAGISQMNNSDPGYGQGALGYAKRYGAGFLDSIDENFMVGAVYPSLFKEDPRYYQLGKGGFFHRTGYSVSRIFLTRTDSGRTQFNFSEFLGSATSVAVGTTYRVGNERHLGDAASDWGTLVGWDAAANLMKEFWPDIHDKFRRSSSRS